MSHATRKHVVLKCGNTKLLYICVVLFRYKCILILCRSVKVYIKLLYMCVVLFRYKCILILCRSIKVYWFMYAIWIRSISSMKTVCNTVFSVIHIGNLNTSAIGISKNGLFICLTVLFSKPGYFGFDDILRPRLIWHLSQSSIRPSMCWC